MTWRNISIGQYQDIQKILSVQPEKGEELFQKIAILSVIYRKPEEYFDNEKRILEYLGPLNDLLKSEPGGVLPVYFKCGGRKFKLNAHDMKSMLTQTYADLCLLTKDPAQIDDNLHLIMATLCTERKSWFSNRAPLSFDDRAEHLRQHCPVSIAMTTALFFWNLLAGFKETLLSYSEKELAKAEKILQAEMKKAQKANGAGTQRYLKWRTAIRKSKRST